MLKKVFFLLVLTAVSIQCQAQGFLKAEGKRIVNENGENVLLRGMGLGGWMLQEGYMLNINKEGQQYRIRERMEDLIGAESTQKFYDAWLRNFVSKIDIDSMRAWGFNSIRLPMHYNLYTLPVDLEPVKGENTWLEKGFILTDSLLSWCKANKMYLILDLHAAPGGQGHDLNISDRDPSKPSLWESEANQKKTIALWKKIAQRYVNEPWIGGYDIINEPNWGFTDPVKDKNGLKEKHNGPLRKLMVEITKAIREVDNNHMIVIEGNGWGKNYNGILPPWDNNMVLSFHKYWNFNNQQSISHILSAREQYNVPVWLGESGENSNVWFTEAIRLFEQNNIGWAWWPVKKLGVNNPLEIRSNPQYEQVVRYWNGRGEKPTANNARSGLMELVENTRFEKNIIHRDVLDAMFRQPHTNATLPFKAHLLAKNTTINAVDYDMGKNGYAYYDRDTANYFASGVRSVGNRGGVYRNDGVDIRLDSTQKDNYYVSDTENGEWLQYSVSVKKGGEYKLRLSLSSASDTSRISVLSNDRALLKSIPLPNTGGTSHWKSVELNKIRLNPGLNTLRIQVNNGGFNFRHIEFVKD